MRKDSNIITLKIKYSSDSSDKILEYIKNYNNVLRFTYNRLQENNKLSTAEVTVLQHKINNIFVDSHFKNSARYEALALFEKKNVIFGGKKLFIDRCKNKVSKEDFEIKKLLPICSIGESVQKSNRKFQIIDCSSILFKPDTKNHIVLNLSNLSVKYMQYLTLLCELQELKQIPITYKLDVNYVYVSFDYSVLHNCNVLSDVYYEGSEADWQKIEIKSGNDCLRNANIHFNSTITLTEENIIDNELNLSFPDIDASGTDLTKELNK